MKKALFDSRPRLICLAVLPIIVCAAWLGALCLKGAFSHQLKQRAASQLKIYGENGAVFDDQAGIYGKASGKLEFANVSDKNLTVGAGEHEVFTLAPGEKRTLISDSPIALLTVEGSRRAAFVWDGVSLESALERGFDDVVIAGDITLQDKIVFSFPCRVDTLDHRVEGVVRLETDECGDMVILSKKPGTLTFEADAPKVNVTTSGSPLTYSDELSEYYLKTGTLNGRELDNLAYPVDSFEMLKALSGSAAENARITVIKSFVFTEDLSFEVPVSFDLKAPVDLNSKVIRITTDSEADIYIDADSYADPAGFVISAPNARLHWTGYAPDPDVLSETAEVSEYNGESMEPYRLGGDCGAILTGFTAHCEDLAAPLAYSEEGKLLRATLDLTDDFYCLKNAFVTFEISGGELYFNGEKKESGFGADLTKRSVVTLRDENGAEKKLLLKAGFEYRSLPVIEIVTEDLKEIDSKGDYVNAVITVVSNGSGFDSLPETPVQIRGRGNSTWKWQKKPFKLKFGEDISLFGLAASNEWALLSNYADKSLIRNALAYEMAKKLCFDYTPTQYPVDVFVNGKYQGVYTFGEHLEAADGRVELTEDPDPKKCGYFLEVGGVDSSKNRKGVDYFHADTIKHVLIKHPSGIALGKTHFDYISDWFMRADKAVVAQDGWRELVDEETLIDWIIMMELSNNTDGAYRRSCYYTKQGEGKLKMGPVWDFDLAFGNFNRDKANYDQWATTTDDDYVGVTWTAYLLQDKEFVEALQKRWNEVRDTLLDTAKEYIEAARISVGPSANENFRVWRTLDLRTTMQRSDVTRYNTYDKQLDYIEKFLEKRAAWLDGELQRLADGGVYVIPVIEKEEK